MDLLFFSLFWRRRGHNPEGLMGMKHNFRKYAGSRRMASAVVAFGWFTECKLISQVNASAPNLTLGWLHNICRPSRGCLANRSWRAVIGATRDTVGLRSEMLAAHCSLLIAVGCWAG